MIIANTKTLHFVLEKDKKHYLRASRKEHFLDWIFQRENIVLWDYIKTMRYCAYYTNNKTRTPWHSLMYWWYHRLYNKKCIKLGLIIGANAFSEGLCIYHTGNIVVNGYAKIGKNCHLHGSNCIGNSHSDNDVPTIGDNVRLGVGAKVIGNITIANNVTIAAGAVVVKSCLEEGVTLAGVPAKIIRKK